MKIYEIKLNYNLLQLGEETRIDTPAKVVDYMQGAFDEDPTVEWFYVIGVDRKNHPLGRIMVTKGIATASLVHPREVFKPLILAGAAAFIAVHNHPSGDSEPSAADTQMTKKLREAAAILSIDLLDHVIIGDKSQRDFTGYFSFQENGLI